MWHTQGRQVAVSSTKAGQSGVLTANRHLVEDIDRRNVLRGAVSLGALTLLTGCDVTEEEPVQNALRTVSAWNDRRASRLFRPDHLAPTFRPAQVVKPPRFNAHYDSADVNRSMGRVGSSNWPGCRR